MLVDLAVWRILILDPWLYDPSGCGCLSLCRNSRDASVLMHGIRVVYSAEVNMNSSWRYTFNNSALLVPLCILHRRTMTDVVLGHTRSSFTCAHALCIWTRSLRLPHHRALWYHSSWFWLSHITNPIGEILLQIFLPLAHGKYARLGVSGWWCMEVHAEDVFSSLNCSLCL